MNRTLRRRWPADNDVVTHLETCDVLMKFVHVARQPSHKQQYSYCEHSRLHCSQSLLQYTALKHLVLLLIRIVTHNVEELQAVLALAGADHTQPVPQLLLLQELLGQVLEVPTAELLVRDDLDAPIAQVVDGDVIAEVASAALNLDALLQEGGERGRVEDAIGGGLGRIDDVLK